MYLLQSVRSLYERLDQGSTHRSMRVGAIFFSFDWCWCGVSFWRFCSPGAVRILKILVLKFQNFAGLGAVLRYQGGVRF